MNWNEAIREIGKSLLKKKRVTDYGQCSICRYSYPEDRIQNMPGFFIHGSEGVEICDNCKLLVLHFMQDLSIRFTEMYSVMEEVEKKMEEDMNERLEKKKNIKEKEKS